MKEFKFACPVCGQHITAAAETSGTQIECPTCFQRIVVPQERSDDTKLILNASMAERPKRPQSVVTQEVAAQPQPTKPRAWLFALAASLALTGVGAAAFLTRDRWMPGGGELEPATPSETSHARNPAPPAPLQTRVENKLWTLEPDKAGISSEPAKGMLHGEAFELTRSTLQGGTLSLRKGASWPPELAVAIVFPAKRGEDLAGKKVVVTVEQPGAPKVTLRWKTGETNSQAETFKSGYLLKLNFGQPENQKMPGEIFVALPDELKSAISGTFLAEIRRPEPPRQKRPKQGAQPAPVQ
jgi:DNA-directed RNA polymerase subunit RPC12/RpoP